MLLISGIKRPKRRKRKHGKANGVVVVCRFVCKGARLISIESVI